MKYTEDQLTELFNKVCNETTLVSMNYEIHDISMVKYPTDPKAVLKETVLPDNFEDSLMEEERLSEDQLDAIIHQLDGHYKCSGNIYKSESDDEKYVVINDLHIPFHRKEVIEALEKAYGNKGYNLVLGGDILDCYDISTFPKAYAVGLGTEIKTAKEYIKRWSGLFKKVFVVSGNHEGRLASYLRKRISPEVVQFLPDDILENIVNDLKLDNIKYVPGDTYNWFVQIDNVIICHPKSFAKSSLGTAARVQEFFTTRGFTADVFIVAHTHKLGQAIRNGGTIVESGSLCMPQDYAMDGKVSYTPEASGFVVFKSRNNKVGFNDVRLHYVG
jgi:predicted phosphodiesterase